MCDMIQIHRTFIGLFTIITLFVCGACNGSAPLSPDQERFKKEVRRQITALQSVLAPALSSGSADAVDEVLSQYFNNTDWKRIACNYEVRVVDSKKRYVGARIHLKNWDGSLPGPDTRLDYSQYGSSFNKISEGMIFANRFFNTDGPLVIIGGPVFYEGKNVGAFGIMLPGECLPKHFNLSQDDILAIDYNQG